LEGSFVALLTTYAEPQTTQSDELFVTVSDFVTQLNKAKVENEQLVEKEKQAKNRPKRMRQEDRRSFVERRKTVLLSHL